MAKPRRPIPANFVADAPSLSVSAAMKAWAVDFHVLARWERELGVRCKRLKPGPGTKAR